MSETNETGRRHTILLHAEEQRILEELRHRRSVEAGRSVSGSAIVRESLRNAAREHGLEPRRVA